MVVLQYNVQGVIYPSFDMCTHVWPCVCLQNKSLSVCIQIKTDHRDLAAYLTSESNLIL